MRVIVFGGRDYDDDRTVLLFLSQWPFYPSSRFGNLRWDLRDAAERGDITVVHGACPTGADHHADVIAPDLGYDVEPIPADWYAHDWTGEWSGVTCYHRPGPTNRCPAAGPRRNQHMADRGADAAIGFPGGRGTADMERRAKAAGIPTLMVPDLAVVVAE